MTTPRKVLVVEDHKEIAELVRLHLVDLPCHVDLAADGTQGLNRLLVRPISEAVPVFLRTYLL